MQLFIKDVLKFIIL